MGNFSFANTPVIRHSRSRFDLSHSVKLSANVGDLVPFELQEVYAGDTFKVKTACVSRLVSQFFRPVMDNLFLDVYYFFVPSRLLCDYFPNVFGENTQSKWANTIEYNVPTLQDNPAGVCVIAQTGSVADYLGIPVGVDIKQNISVLPFRGFAKIYDDWFRDQNNVLPMHIESGGTNVGEALNSNPWGPNNYTGMLPKVAKFHDYFTSCLPAPQKGSAVDIPLGQFNDVPVGSLASDNTFSTSPMRMNLQNGQNFPAETFKALSIGNGSVDPNKDAFLGFWSGSVGGGNLAQNSPVMPANLWAQTSALESQGFSVNDLRFAFQYQKMLEKDARGGTRYVEYLQNHFGVSAGDYRLQRSEFLGGKRSPLSVTQVTQTTGSNDTEAPLGELGANSFSNSGSRFTKSFTEHGYVFGVFCIRQFHTYQQGLERFWTRTKRTDFYDPVFANIGEQPVYATELYASADKDRVFGYNEAWADLRCRVSRVAGNMRYNPTTQNSLSIWHMADRYSNVPTLSETFINEIPDNLDEVITVPSYTQQQFILDFYIQNIAYRPLPTYSVPSLIDHN